MRGANVHPVLLSIGGLTITSYGALLNLGLIAAAMLTLIQARRADRPAATTIDVMLAAVVAGVIGARLAYVIMHATYFANHPNEAWPVWQGGLSWHGGLIGGMIGVGLIARIRLRQSPAVWLDVLAPGAALGTVFGWIGCFLAACAFGREVFPGEPLFRIAIDLPDAYGAWAPRLPSQLFGAGWGLIVFVVLGLWGGAPAARSGPIRKVECRLTCPRSEAEWGQSAWPKRANPKGGLRTARTPGARCALFVALYAAGSLLIGFSRADATARLGNWSVEQALDASLLAAGVGWILLQRLQRAIGVRISAGDS